MLPQLWRKLKDSDGFTVPGEQDEPRIFSPAQRAKKITRRAIVGMLLATNFCLSPELTPDASAFSLFRGGVAAAGGGSTQITTITLANATGAGDTPQVSTFFGHIFKAGDIPSGQYPIFKIAGTTVPYSISTNPTTWTYGANTGSMFHATFRLLLGGNFTVPQKSGTDGTLSVQIWNGGSAPAASARNPLLDLVTADLKHVVTFLDNGSGTYTATVLDGINDGFAENYTFADGAAGKYIRVRADYKNAGVAESALTSIWWIWIIQNSSGGFGGIEVQGCATLPWMDLSQSSRVWKSFSQCQLYSGASLIRDQVTARTRTVNFSWSSGATFSAPGNTIESGRMFRLSSSGVLPTTNTALTGSITGTTLTVTAISAGRPCAGLELIGAGITAGTNIVKQLTGAAFGSTGTYLVDTSHAGTGSISITTRLGTNGPFWMSSGDAASPAATISIAAVSPIASLTTCTDNGSGTHTITTYPFVSYYTKQFFSGTDGKYDFVQGGGSISAASVSHVQMNQQYWQSTLGIPCWDRTITPASAAAVSYYMNTSAGVPHHLATTGENAQLGIFQLKQVLHLYTQAAADEQSVRVLGLVGANMVYNVRHSSNGQIVPFNNGPGGAGTNYPGLPTIKPNSRWDGDITDSTSDVEPLLQNAFVSTFDEGSSDHLPHFNIYPWLLFGALEFAEGTTEFANAELLGESTNVTNTATISTVTYDLRPGSTRHVTYAGVTRYGLCIFGPSARAEAWGFMRDMSVGAYVIPANHSFFSAAATYLKEVVTENWAYAAVVIANPPTAWAGTAGLFNIPSSLYIKDTWQESYGIQGASWFYGLSGNANAKTFIDTTNKWWAYVVNGPLGAWGVGSSEFLGRVGSAPAALIADDDHVCIFGPSVTWANGSADFTETIVTSGTPFVPSIGDIAIFTTPSPPSEVSLPNPTAITSFAPSYAVAVSGAGPWTVQYSATRVGGAITNTNAWSSVAGSIATLYCGQPVNIPATGTFSGNTADGYLSNMYKSQLLSQSRGAVTNSAALTLMAARLVSQSAFQTNPKYAFSNDAAA